MLLPSLGSARKARISARAFCQKARLGSARSIFQKARFGKFWKTVLFQNFAKRNIQHATFVTTENQSIYLICIQIHLKRLYLPKMDLPLVVNWLKSQIYAIFCPKCQARFRLAFKLTKARLGSAR